LIPRIILATQNQDKVREIIKLLQGLTIEVVTLRDYPDTPDVLEDGETLTENAVKKASVVAQHTRIVAVADDTGLEVDCLNGAPGVYSSRFSGAHASYADNVAKLLDEMRGVPFEKRHARFRTVIAVCNGRDVKCVEGICDGVISESPEGSNGFGYDPVFYVPASQLTFAEMTLAEKNRVSHRGRAFSNLRSLLASGKFNLNYQC
jgi:XTP/dITP diphosphohydrolase